MDDAVAIYLERAEESLAGAASEFANGRFNNCANRCYYAAFQAAIAALARAEIGPSTGDGRWSHSAVQAQFVGRLINRRKVYPSALQATLPALFDLRAKADYDSGSVTRVEADRARRRCWQFVDAIREGDG